MHSFMQISFNIESVFLFANQQSGLKGVTLFEEMLEGVGNLFDTIIEL